jgi:2-iminobutanoate/2-iminopropanoate deaminase
MVQCFNQSITQCFNRSVTQSPNHSIPEETPMKTTVSTDRAAKPMGPYSQAVRAGGFIYVSGQGPVDPQGNIIEGDIREQTRLALTNIRNILEAAGAKLEDVVRCGVFLADIKDFAAMNEVYTEFFPQNHPARTTVSAVLPGGRVEIDALAHVGN